jgi:hypothetical protein
LKSRGKWGAAAVFAASLAGAGVLSAGPAQAAAQVSGPGNDTTSVELCNESNYVAFAKWVGNGLSQDLTHVNPGTCFTDTLLFPGDVSDDDSGSTATLWMFGINPVTHQGFDLRSDGMEVINGDLNVFNKFLLHATGTPSDHPYTATLFPDDDFTVSGS